MIALALACALVGWIFAFFLVVQNGKDKAALAASYEQTLTVERDRTTQLIAQVQANAQGFQHYPSYGPIEPEPEKRYLSDDTGLIVYDATDDERDFAEVAD